MEQQSYYPLVRPASGTLLYPYRQQAVGNGILEKMLLHTLQSCLPSQVKVLDDVCINVSEHQPLEYLDIALLVEGRPEIRIDVEIDEPYRAVTFAPIHYLTCGDAYRDGVLNRHGWTVVRLAGRQVETETGRCAAFLLRLLQRFVPDLEVSVADTGGPQPVARWTKTEAEKMAARQEQSPECRQTDPAWQPFDGLEMMCQPLVAPLPRTEEMTQKMRSFRDAGLYAQDQYIDFEPEEHIYTYAGRRRLLPVSSLIAWFFEAFDALQAARRQWASRRIPVEESLDKWDRIRRTASEAGTFVHLQTENYFQRGFFETDCCLMFDGQEEHIDVSRERQHFLHFIDDYHIEPYRQEWPVYDKELNIAGTIDLTCREADGSLTIYDWKRSSKVVNALGQPIIEAYGDKRGFNGINLPDTSYYHYCIQQNLYRYMLEAHYGVKVRAMNLVVLSPDYPTYFVVPIPKMDDVIRQVLRACRSNALGYRLLA